MESRREPVSRYRLYVAASNAIDLIAGAGGWVADHAMAGWDVRAFIADGHEDRDGQLLQILGAAVVKLQTAHFREPNTPHTLAISPDLYQQNVRLRAHVSRAINRGKPQVIFLGHSYPAEMPGTPTKSRASLQPRRPGVQDEGTHGGRRFGPQHHNSRMPFQLGDRAAITDCLRPSFPEHGCDSPTSKSGVACPVRSQRPAHQPPQAATTDRKTS